MTDLRRTIRFLALLCVISVSIMMLTLLSGEKSIPFTPPPFDPESRTGIPEVPDALAYRMLDAGPFRAGLCGILIPEDGRIPVWFTNPPENTVWLRLRILDDQGRILGETGLLRPGEHLRSVIADPLPPAGAPVVLKVMAYEPEVYHSAGTFTVRTTISKP